MSANPIDLTTVAKVKTWLSSGGLAPSNTDDDPQIQACITSFSAMFLWRTCKGNQDGEEPSESPFVAPISYTEVYDGNGKDRIWLRNSPIQSVTSVIVGTVTLTLSTGFNSPGVTVSGNKKYIFICRGNTGIVNLTDLGYGWGGCFPRGRQNVQVVYSAGYNSTPDDIEMAARKAAALNYKRRDWIGLRSKSLGQGAGSTSYQDWEYDPDVERLISNYTRYAMGY